MINSVSDTSDKLYETLQGNFHLDNVKEDDMKALIYYAGVLIAQVDFCNAFGGFDRLGENGSAVHDLRKRVTSILKQGSEDNNVKG